jgi:epoxyqueuosine reductase
MHSKSKYAIHKIEAKRSDFLSCGISKAGFLEEEAPRLENWLKKNQNGQMSFMESHFDKRLNPVVGRRC